MRARHPVPPPNSRSLHSLSLRYPWKSYSYPRCALLVGFSFHLFSLASHWYFSASLCVIPSYSLELKATELLKWQVYVSLILARFLTNYLWSKGHDPDMYAMPIHSSVVDLVGQLLLVMCFEVVASLGGKVEVQPGHAH